jgi:hypothetical protein
MDFVGVRGMAASHCCATTPRCVSRGVADQDRREARRVGLAEFATVPQISIPLVEERE